MGAEPLFVPRFGTRGKINLATIAPAMAWPLLCGSPMLKFLIRWCWKSLSVPEFLTVGKKIATLGCRKVKAGGGLRKCCGVCTKEKRRKNYYANYVTTTLQNAQRSRSAL